MTNERGEQAPVAWMRRYAFDGINVMAMKPKDRPRGWKFLEVTKAKIFDDDVPLVPLLPQGRAE